MDTRPKGSRMYVYLGQEIRDALEAMARGEHRKLTEMARECIRREAVRQDVWPETEDAK